MLFRTYPSLTQPGCWMGKQKLNLITDSNYSKRRSFKEPKTLKENKSNHFVRWQLNRTIISLSVFGRKNKACFILLIRLTTDSKLWEWRTSFHTQHSNQILNIKNDSLAFWQSFWSCSLCRLGVTCCLDVNTVFSAGSKNISEALTWQRILSRGKNPQHDTGAMANIIPHDPVTREGYNPLNPLWISQVRYKPKATDGFLEELGGAPVQYGIHLLQRMGDEGAWRVRSEPSGRGMLTRKTSRARVLFFLDPATPIRASTSAFRSFRIPTQSTLREMAHTSGHHRHTPWVFCRQGAQLVREAPHGGTIWEENMAVPLTSKIFPTQRHLTLQDKLDRRKTS